MRTQISPRLAETRGTRHSFLHFVKECIQTMQEQNIGHSYYAVHFHFYYYFYVLFDVGCHIIIQICQLLYNGLVGCYVQFLQF